VAYKRKLRKHIHLSANGNGGGPLIGFIEDDGEEAA